jgi:hypothetical protein
VSLFKRKTVDPIELLHGNLVAIRSVWQMYGVMPAKQQHNAVTKLPATLRDAYQAAKAVDALRADGLIAEARNNPIRSGPAELSWPELLDFATS